MKGKQKIWIAMAVFMALISLSVFVGSASANTIYVPDNYTKIQWAVDNATAGSTIIVGDGTYTENVNVNKSSLTIQSENGSANCIVQAADSGDHVFEVTADYVNISGFTVKGANKVGGIYLYNAGNCIISNNNASNNYDGIYLRSSSNNTINGNSVSKNSDEGIYLSGSSNNTITNNTVNANHHYCGISLSGSSNNTLTNNTVSNNGYGIWLFPSSNNNTLTKNTVNSNSRYGIHLTHSSNNALINNAMSGNEHNFGVSGSSLSHFIQNIDTSNKVEGKPVYYWVNQQNQQIPSDAGYVGIVNSTNITVRDLILTKNWKGVLFAYTENSRIENVTASDNYIGIDLYSSSNNLLTNNSASDNFASMFNHGKGIFLYSSSNNTLTNNTMSGQHNFGVHGNSLSHFIQNIDTSNLVEGKPIYYWINEKDKEIPNDAGYVGIVNSTNITVRDLTLVNNDQGVLLAYSENSRIENVIAPNKHRFGIYLYSSSNNMLTNNIVDSSWSNIAYGIYLGYSSNNTITNNTANGNYLIGIELSSSSNNTLTDNTANENFLHGIYLYSSSNNMLTNNTANSNNNDGIDLWRSSNNTLTGNTAIDNNKGIYLYYSSNNTLTNNIAWNNSYGIYLHSSSENEMYLNNFMNNTDNNVYSEDSTNIWNSSEVMTYTYNESTYRNYLGNYWSDYIFEGNDTNRDGIGDSPYNIDSDNDSYPLIEPFESYLIVNKPPISSLTYSPLNPVVNETITFDASNSTDIDGYITKYEWDFGDGNNTNTTEPIITHSYASAGTYNANLTVTDDEGATNSTSKLITVSELEENIFDTGSPSTPYPSIMGNHTGTIKPKHTIIATKLYTYPCLGTGGHTEYARICNKTWNSTATWEGYAGDWHNITFDKTVVLLANETYNYTIRTGSYPQIIHTDEWEAERGMGIINCTSFVDANGKVYNDWIPAIKLF